MNRRDNDKPRPPYTKPISQRHSNTRPGPQKPHNFRPHTERNKIKYDRVFEENREDEIPPREDDTPLIKDIRAKNIQGACISCTHPGCMTPRSDCRFRDNNIALCDNHAPREDLSQTLTFKVNGGDLVPFANRGLAAFCSELRKPAMGAPVRQFTFVCNNCGVVCAHCSKKCYATGHHLLSARYGLGMCTMIRLVGITKTTTYSYVEKGSGEVKKEEFTY